MTLSERVHEMTPNERLDRLAEIRPLIEAMTDFYNAKAKRVGLFLAWADKQKNPECKSIGMRELGHRGEDLVEFVHNLCTNLCAEKMLLEDIIRRS